MVHPMNDQTDSSAENSDPKSASSSYFQKQLHPIKIQPAACLVELLIMQYHSIRISI